MVDYALADAIYKKLISVGATPATAQIAYNSILGITPSITAADTAYRNVLAEETKRADQIYAASIAQGNTKTGAQATYDSIIKIGKMYAQVTYDYIKANITATTPPVTATPIHGQRYCVDSQTYGIWNQVSGKYDIGRCPGICKDGNCVSSTTTPVIKELVTNLTTDENLIKASIILTGTVADDYTYVGKYTEGINTVFQFRVVKGVDYAEFGAGAGLSNFITANWKSIASLLALLGVASIVWAWRDSITKNVDVQGKISDDIKDNITEILADKTLTAEQKSALISEVLKAVKYTPEENQTAALVESITYLVVIILIGLIVVEFMKKKR